MKKVMPLNLIIALRFLGLFIVLPVLSVYTLSLPGANHTIVGLVIGGYAIMQVILQVPFGMMSDFFGRKETILMGLILIALGSFIAGIATDVLTLLLGRLLQGAGAIGAVVTATISDLVKDEYRTKAMAMMGGSIAISFAVSMVAGPLIGAKYGVDTIFFIVTILTLLSMIILYFVPTPPKIEHKSSKDWGFLKDKNIVIMNITNFLQKGFMTFAFLIIPIVLIKTYSWNMDELWKAYLPAMVFGILSMGAGAVIAEKKGKFKQVLMGGIIFFAISYYIMGNSNSDIFFVVGVVLFFLGFNMHEPIMQSLTSKYAKANQKGRVLGVFNSFGYFGTFAGGAFGGFLLDSISLSTISLIIVIISIAWLMLIVILPNPALNKTAYIHLDKTDKNNHDKLNNLKGCIEWYINHDEQILVVKYNTKILNENKIKEFLK